MRDWNKEMFWGSLPKLEKKVKDKYGLYGFYWVTFSEKDSEHSKYDWNPKMFLYFLMEECEDKRCFVWHDRSCVTQASMIPPPASSGEELFSWSCCCKYFTRCLPFYACRCWKAGKQSQKSVTRTHSKSKQLEHLVWDLLRGQKSDEICLVDLFDRIYCFN